MSTLAISLRAAFIAFVLAAAAPGAVLNADEGRGGGFGGQATGGGNAEPILVRNVKELEAALKKGDCVVQLDAKEFQVDRKIATAASNITLDGMGNTIRGDKLNPSMQMIEFSGKNIVVRNVRLRNGGDNLSLKGASDVLVEHVSTTGAGDDGISVGYGTKNVTVRFCFFGGNTRSLFAKYEGADRVTINHCIFCKFWIRGPLMSDIPAFDIRNCWIQEWNQHGTKIEGTASNGNIMGNIYWAPKDSRGARKDSPIWIKGGVGKLHIADCDFRCEGKNDQLGTAAEPQPAPEILPAYTTDMKQLEALLMSETEGAGCMPRDAIDKRYLAERNWSIGGSRAFRIPETGKPLP